MSFALKKPGRSAVVCAVTGTDFAVVAVIAANATERRRSRFVIIFVSFAFQPSSRTQSPQSWHTKTAASGLCKNRPPISGQMSAVGRLGHVDVSGSLPLRPYERTSLSTNALSEKCQQRKSRLFDHLVATGEHLAAMVIRAARLAAILLRIAKGLRPA